MNYKSFAEEIERKVREKIPEDCTVEIRPVRKNNGVMLDAVMIRRPQELTCPNIYLNQIYESFREGMTMDQAVERILKTYHSAIPVLKLEADQLINQDIIREQVVYRLINCGKNRELLENVPHKRVLDLALVYYVMIENEQMGRGAVMVQNPFLKYYDIPEDELDQAAMKNTPRLMPADFIRLSDLLREFGEKTGAYSYSEISLEDEACAVPLYVLTNRARQYGAYYLTDTKGLSEISRKLDSDLFLLPSSVHECMVVPADCWENPEDLAQMVWEINREQVSAEEYLADSVYRYSRREGSLKIA